LLRPSVATAVFFTRFCFFLLYLGFGVFIENLGFFDSGQILEMCVVWLPMKGGAWLRRFDDVPGLGKSCVAKGMNRKKAKEKYFIIAHKYALPPNI